MKAPYFAPKTFVPIVGRWMYCSLLLLLFLQTPAMADLVNQDTGEGWHPTFDDQGNVQDPPAWVVAQNPGIIDYINSEGHLPPTPEDTVLLNVDMCQSPINEWISATTDASVGSVISDPSTFSALKSEIKRWADNKISRFVGNQDSSLGITVSPININQLECRACEMTYLQCLLTYQDGTFCKKYIGCGKVPTSYVNAILPVSSSHYGLSGKLNMEGSLRYRETELTSGKILRERCLHVDTRTAVGFSPFNDLVESTFDDALDSNGDLCRGAGHDPSP